MLTLQIGLGALQFGCTVKDANGNAFDLTGYSVCQVSKALFIYENKNKILQRNGDPTTEGIVTMSLTATQTGALKILDMFMI